MWTYVVIRSSSYGDVIDKVFTSKPKADNYLKEQTNSHPTFAYRIEEHFAV